MNPGCLFRLGGIGLRIEVWIYITIYILCVNRKQTLYVRFKMPLLVSPDNLPETLEECSRLPGGGASARERTEMLRPLRKMRSCFLAITILLMGAAGLQAATVVEGVDRIRLENGLTVLLKEVPSSAVSSVQVWVNAGSANETEAEAGITHFIEHMIFKGTPRRQTGEIARTIEAAGGNINAYTSLDRTVYFAEIPASETDTAVDVLLDAVQFSLFDEEEIAREKEVVLEEYRRMEDIPDRRLGREMMALCFEKHPYGRPVIGTMDTIRAFDREAIIRYMDKWYRAENMVMVAIGKFDRKEILHRVKDLTRDFPERPGSGKAARPAEPPQEKARTLMMQEKVGQAYLEMAWHIPPLLDADIPALDLLGAILGDGKISRLHSRLRIDERLVNSVSAGAYALKDPGLFFVSSTLSPEHLGQVLTIIGEEAALLGTAPVNPSELERAVNQVEADFLFGMESVSGQARTLGFFEMLGGGYQRVETYLADLRAVGPADVQRVARRYLRPQNLSMGILLPSETTFQIGPDEIAALFEPVSSRAAGGEEREAAPQPISMRVFPNGMRVIVKENHELPVFSAVGVFLGGSRLEPADKAGLSRFMALMLTRGTENRTMKDIASTLDGWAGQLEGFSGRNSFGLSGRFLSKEIYPAMLLFSECLLKPSFPEAEVEKVREDLLAAIRSKEDRPTALLFDLLEATLYRQHPYGRPETGTIESVAGIRRSDLTEWFGRMTFPSNFVLAVVGDVHSEDLFSFLESLFSSFTSSSPSGVPEVAGEAPLAEPRLAHLERAGAQTHLAVGYLGVSIKDPAHASMALVDGILSGMGGRLFRELRDKESLAYSVTAFRRPGLETGLFAVYLACDPAKAGTGRDMIFKELARLRDEGVSEEELGASKRYLLGQMAIDRQTNGSQAMQMSLDELYGLGYDHQARFIEAIEKVTPADVLGAVRSVFKPEGYVVVSVGPGAGGS